MIVNEPLGAAEYDEKQPFGCPYHGLVQGGKLTLPNGEQIDYPQPIGDLDEEVGRTLIISPPWAKGGNASAEQIAQGFEWQNHAILAGGNSQLHGQPLGRDCWLWAEAPGKVWLVDPKELLALDPVTAGGMTINLHLSRFGWLGELPAKEEKTKIITIQLPEDLGQTTAYPNLYREHESSYIYDGVYWGGFENKVSFRLQDTRPSDGALALFGAVCTRAKNRAQQYNVVSVFQIDLQSASFQKIVGREAIYVVEVDTEEEQGERDISVYANLQQVSSSGGCQEKSDSISTYVYVEAKSRNATWHNSGNFSYKSHFIVKYLLGAAFDKNNQPTIIWARGTEDQAQNNSAVFTSSGENITTCPIAFDESGNCYQPSPCTYENSAIADSVTVRESSAVITIEILAGEQVLVSRTSSATCVQNASAHTDPSGFNSGTSSVVYNTLGWDGETYTRSDTISASDDDGYVLNNSEGVSAYLMHDPILNNFDYIAVSSVPTDDWSTTYGEAFCLGPGRFCLRDAHPSGDLYYVGDVRPSLVNYDDFCTVHGPLNLPKITQTEKQALASQYYQTWQFFADPIFCSGVSSDLASASHSPTSVV